MKVLVACANGAGTSLMLSMTVKRVFEKNNLKMTRMHHCAIAEGKSSANQYDLIFTTQNFKDHFELAERQGKKVLAVQNVMSDAEVQKALKEEGLL